MMALPEVLTAIYETNSVLGPDGNPQATRSHVVREFAEAIHHLLLIEKPEVVLEVGLAYGITALAITSALEQNGKGRLISIDPYQSTNWQRIGQLNIERAGLSHRHELLEVMDFEALPSLLARGVILDAAYIDGLHSYEYALLDFFYVDRLLRVGGVVGFNDSDWPAVLPTLHFAEQHRDYERIEVGLPPLYGIRNNAVRRYQTFESRLPASTRPSRVHIVGRLLGRHREDRYYRKRSTYEPPEGWMPRATVRALQALHL